MKHLPENESQEVLSGLIERLTHDNADNGFCVLRAKLLALHSDLL
jgi:exodeoxyribonuclease V alpha subunit